MEPTGNNNTLPPTGTTTYPTISSDGGGVVSIYSTDFVLAQNI